MKPTTRSDALVLFGGTGDLARRKIYPALLSLVRSGALDVPVVVVAHSDLDEEGLRHYVGDALREQGRLDDMGLAEAQAEPLGLAAVTPEPREARYFLDALRRQLPDFYDAELLTSEGLRIYSTLDLRLQKVAAAALHEGLADLEQRHPKLKRTGDQALQGCLVALRPQTGEVLALVGGRSYGESQFDRCTQARRQAGSVFKPIVYATALSRQSGPAVTLASFVPDEPIEVQTPSGPWRTWCAETASRPTTRRPSATPSAPWRRTRGTGPRCGTRRWRSRGSG